MARKLSLGSPIPALKKVLRDTPTPSGTELLSAPYSVPRIVGPPFWTAKERPSAPVFPGLVIRKVKVVVKPPATNWFWVYQAAPFWFCAAGRSEEHTSELQSRFGI